MSRNVIGAIIVYSTCTLMYILFLWCVVVTGPAILSIYCNSRPSIHETDYFLGCKSCICAILYVHACAEVENFANYKYNVL